MIPTLPLVTEQNIELFDYDQFVEIDPYSDDLVIRFFLPGRMYELNISNPEQSCTSSPSKYIRATSDKIFYTRNGNTKNKPIISKVAPWTWIWYIDHRGVNPLSFFQDNRLPSYLSIYENALSLVEWRIQLSIQKTGIVNTEAIASCHLLTEDEIDMLVALSYDERRSREGRSI